MNSQASKVLMKIRDFSVDLHAPAVTVRPVRHVSYDVSAGEVLAIVGESGSGKTILNLSPLGLLATGVIPDLSGRVEFEGTNLVGLNSSELQKIRGREIGVIFQDPLSALNPMRRIGRQITEVSELHLGLTPQAAEDRAVDLLKLVGIPDPKTKLKQYPHELSGGMRQRIMIAIAISAEPKLIIADEPTSALDVTVQAQIVRLLKDLQKRLDMAIVLITHDIGVVSGVADQLAVMYAGSIVESGPATHVLVNARHPYTQGLLASVARLDAKPRSAFVGLPGLPPDLSGRFQGCRFADRCTHVMAQCAIAPPPLLEVDPGHWAACPVLNQAPVKPGRKAS